MTRDLSICIYSANGAYGDVMGEHACTSGKAAIGPVRDGTTGEVVYTAYECADCMAHQAYSDWYKSEHGIRPRWMTRDECIEAWWSMPEVAGVRP